MIYIHVPFCKSFCTYCDFYSELSCGKDEGAVYEVHKRYFEALSAELLSRNAEPKGCLNTLYIGGGTPSVLPPSFFRKLVSRMEVCGYGRDFTEFTVEVNPDDIVSKGMPYIEALMSAGANRISMGVQSFDDELLVWMNRRHDGAVAAEAYRLLRAAGVQNISIDLIFGISHLSDGLWMQTIRKALDLPGGPPEHISAYQLSIEEGSVLNRMVSEGKYKEAGEEQCARQYEILCNTLREAGYTHYEISNFALPGFEAKHNSGYWSGESYLGFGPGAHSYDSRYQRKCRSWNKESLSEYMEAARNGSLTTVREMEKLSEEQVGLETIMLSLRTSSGIPLHRLKKISSEAKINRMLASGDLVEEGDNLRIPESRFFVSDAIIADLALR